MGQKLGKKPRMKKVQVTTVLKQGQRGRKKVESVSWHPPLLDETLALGKKGINFHLFPGSYSMLCSESIRSERCRVKKQQNTSE
jgi:hypothetical protein